MAGDPVDKGRMVWIGKAASPRVQEGQARGILVRCPAAAAWPALTGEVLSPTKMTKCAPIEEMGAHFVISPT
ncbi:hypothetical protein [Streptomyces sp. NPDC001537]